MSEKSPNIPNITNVPQVLGFRADNPLLSDLRDTCTHYGISRSRLVRLLVADGLQRLSYGRCRTLEENHPGEQPQHRNPENTETDQGENRQQMFNN